MHISLDSALGRHRRLNSVGESVLQIAPDAAAAYSLRSLTGGDPDVVRVRRESDNTEKDFSGSQIESGEMARWVNEQPTLPLDLRELDTNTGERDGALIEAAAAYSLRKLKEDFTGDVVEVRRNVDGETEGFTADEVTDGTLESWVEGEEVTYESDFSAGEDGWFGEQSTITGNVDSIDGRNDCLEVVSTATNYALTGKSLLSASKRYKVSADVYIQQGANIAQLVLANGGTHKASILNPQEGVWLSLSADFVADSSQIRVSCGSIALGGTYYIRNVKVISYAENELPLDQATGAAAAYSLRSLKASGTDVTTSGDTAGDTTGKYVVQVRRSSDDAVQSFTASEVADGTLEDWAGELHNYLPLPSSFGHWQASSTGGQTDPDGGAGAYLLTHTGASTSNPNGRTSNVPFGSGTYTFSCYLKEGTWGVVNLFFDDYDGTRFRQEFDLSSGSLGSDQSGNVDNATITDVGSGWYFCTMTVTSSTTIYDDVGVGLYSDTPFASASGETAYYYQPHVVRGTEPATEYIAKSVSIFGDGHVRTWYDQSGSDNHAVQTTLANQPKIVDAGALVTGGIDFNGAEYLSRSSFTQGDLEQPNTIFSVAKMDSNDDTNRKVYDGETGAGRNMLFLSPEGSGQFGIYSGSTLLTGDTATSDKHLFTASYNSTSSEFFIDGTSEASGDAGNYSMDAIVIGANHDEAGSFWLGQIQEIIIYNSDQSTKRRAIEENIANHYGISLAAFSRDGTVSTWYDQSGNTNDATQTDPTKQPKIVDSGTYLEEVDFNGTSHYLDLSSPLGTTTEAAVFTVAESGGGTDNLILDNRDGGTDGFRLFKFGPDLQFRWQSAVVDTATAISSDTKFLGFANHDSSNASAAINGATANSVADTSSINVAATPRIGARSFTSPSGYWDGTINELIIYNSDQSDNRTAIEANIGETYGITDIPAADDTVNGFVQTWYDQSGSGNDAVQNAAANQPKIVGEVTSGQPHAFLGAIEFDGSDDFLSINFGAVLSQPNSIFMVHTSDTTTDTENEFFDFEGGGPNRTLLDSDGGNYRLFSGSVLNTGEPISTSQTLLSALYNGSSSLLSKNGTVGTTGDVGSNAIAQTSTLGKSDGTGGHYDGTMDEFIIYNSNQSSNRPAIEANIANQYGITLS